MRFYEIHNHVEPGFKISLTPTPGVNMCFDSEHNNWMTLPVGRSIKRYLVHPDDQSHGWFRLHFGDLRETSQGLCLVSQPEEAAEESDLALVLVDRSLDWKVGFTRVQPARGCSRPQLITYAGDREWRRELYRMHPGSGLYIDWSNRATDERHKFRAVWDGRELKETTTFITHA